jgi:hypothetical protein
MLKENHPEEVKQGLSRLRGKVDDLKRSFYQDRLKMKIQDLVDIKVKRLKHSYSLILFASRMASYSLYSALLLTRAL